MIPRGKRKSLFVETLRVQFLALFHHVLSVNLRLEVDVPGMLFLDLPDPLLPRFNEVGVVVLGYRHVGDLSKFGRKRLLLKSVLNCN